MRSRCRRRLNKRKSLLLVCFEVCFTWKQLKVMEEWASDKNKTGDPKAPHLPDMYNKIRKLLFLQH